MDEETLKWLSKLEESYPFYQNVGLLIINLRPLYYLYEKKLVELKVSSGYGAYIEEKLDDILEEQETHATIKARLTARGIDVIDSLMKELKEEKNFSSPDKERGKLLSVINSPIYQEVKDWIITFFAKITEDKMQ